MLYFGVPAVAMSLCFQVLMPALIEGGILPFYAHSVALISPLAGLLLAAALAYRLEGNRFAWSALAARFRWRCMDGRAWLWTPGVWVVQLALWFLLQRLSAWLIAQGIIPVPQYLPALLDPGGEVSRGPCTTRRLVACRGIGASSLPRWRSFFNIAGEELWWQRVEMGYPHNDRLLSGTRDGVGVHPSSWGGKQ